MQTDTDDLMMAPEAPPAPMDDLRATLEAALSEPEGPPDSEAPTTVADEGIRAAETPSPEPEADGDAPPVSWTKEAKQAWDLVPQTARDEIRRREREISAALSQSAEGRKLGDALQPYVDQMRAAGVEPAQYVANLLNWNAALRTQPTQAIAALTQQFIGDAQSARAVVQALAQRFGLDEWGDLGDGRAAEAAAAPQIVQLEQRLRQQELQAAQREWSDFVGAKSADGKPLHPHADACKAEMADAIRANPNLSFAEAYERAKWINPQVRERILQDEAATRARAGQQRVAKARGMELPRGRGGEAGFATRDDLRAELREQLARAGARVSE